MSFSCMLLLCVLPWVHGVYWLPRVADPGPCVPPSNASAPVGLRGYSRFHANDSLLGHPLPCTHEDKLCFRHNMLFEPIAGVCEPFGGFTERCQQLMVNRTELESGSGRLVSTCQKYVDPCTGYRMAYDGRCYPKEVVRDVICGCEAKPHRHYLYGVECRAPSATSTKIQQPKEDGRCVIPDLRFPDVKRSIFFSNSFSAIHGFESDNINTVYNKESPYPTFKCEPSQATCFSQKKVYVSGYDGCHKLLERGPCPEDHVVALDVDAATAGRAEATCVHVRGGCPPGHKRLMFDGQCHGDKDIYIEAPGDVLWNQFGQYVIIQHDSDVTFTPSSKNDTICQIVIRIYVPGASISPVKPPCGADDKGLCKLYEVENDPPLPEI